MTRFKTEEDFTKYLHRLLRKEHFLKAVEHERAHARVAQSLGYKVQYYVEVTKNFFGLPIYCNPYIIFRPRTTNQDHIRQIVSAPTDLSPSDIRQLENLK